jgi:uracil-DNA glycosylase
MTLGKIAFEEYLKSCRELGHPVVRPKPTFSHGNIVRLPWNVSLVGSYHPSQQNTFTGKLTRPMFHQVFRVARKMLDATSSPVD